MAVDVSALFAEAKALGMYEEVKPRAYKHRRYNVTVDGNIIAQSCTMQDVRTLRDHYRKQGKAIVSEEAYTPLPAPILPKIEQYSVAEMPGLQNFATPTMTEKKAEAQKQRRHKEIPAKPSAERQIESPWRMKKSSLHEEYMKGVIRDGFVITDKETGNVIFWGQRNETVGFLKQYSGNIQKIKAIPFTRKHRKEMGL